METEEIENNLEAFEEEESEEEDSDESIVDDDSPEALLDAVVSTSSEALLDAMVFSASSASESSSASAGCVGKMREVENVNETSLILPTHPADVDDDSEADEAETIARIPQSASNEYLNLFEFEMRDLSDKYGESAYISVINSNKVVQISDMNRILGRCPKNVDDNAIRAYFYLLNDAEKRLQRNDLRSLRSIFWYDKGKLPTETPWGFMEGTPMYLGVHSIFLAFYWSEADVDLAFVHICFDTNCLTRITAYVRNALNLKARQGAALMLKLKTQIQLWVINTCKGFGLVEISTASVELTIIEGVHGSDVTPSLFVLAMARTASIDYPRISTLRDEFTLPIDDEMRIGIAIELHRKKAAILETVIIQKPNIIRYRFLSALGGSSIGGNTLDMGLSSFRESAMRVFIQLRARFGIKVIVWMGAAAGSEALYASMLFSAMNLNMTLLLYELQFVTEIITNFGKAFAKNKDADFSEYSLYDLCTIN